MGKKNKYSFQNEWDSDDAYDVLQMGDKVPLVIYSWKYPDGTCAGALYDRGKSVFTDSFHGNKARRKSWRKRLKKKAWVLGRFQNAPTVRTCRRECA